jgi:2-oxoglutarate ferredoxin oxidoreductase subunit gamma
MMRKKDRFELMIVGLGGLGALFAGRALAEAGMQRYKNVLYFPNYGPYMRLGDSECTVILSDNEITAHCTMNPEAVIVMGAVPLAKFESRMPAGSLMIVDSSVQPGKPSRKDVKYVFVPATRVANDLGNKLGANFVLLGAYIQATDAVAIGDVDEYLNVRMAGDKRKQARELNQSALREGTKHMSEYKASNHPGAAPE